MDLFWVALTIAVSVFAFCDEKGVKDRTLSAVFVTAALGGLWGGFWLAFTLFFQHDALTGYEMIAYLAVAIIGGSIAWYMSKHEDRRSEFQKQWDKTHKT